MKYTLLETVQLILSAMDSDEVNSISDTTESLQVANMAKSVFYDMCVDMNLPAYSNIFQLEPSLDSTQPTLMTAPTSLLQKIDWVQYNIVDPTIGETNANYQFCEYIKLEDFIIRQTGFRNATSGVGEMSVVVQGETFKFMYQTDQFPTYYTTFDDKTYLFNAYRADIDTTLQKSKTLCSGMQYQLFLLQDTFVPALEPTQFSLFINKLKVRAFTELKQQDNKEASAETRRQKIVQQKRKRQSPDLPEIYKVASRYGKTSMYGDNFSILQRWGRDGT